MKKAFTDYFPIIIVPIVFLSVLGVVFLCTFVLGYKAEISNNSDRNILAASISTNTDVKITSSEVVLDNLPESVYLDVPFILQAPFGQWKYPFTHTCEEASVLMIHYYLSGVKIVDENITKKELLSLVDFENENYGVSDDTTAVQTAQLIRDYYGYDAQVFYDISLDDIKKELAAGNPVIIPAAGRLLQNPNFTPPGPVFHMLVIKGYNKDGFITNDDGTRNGKDYEYSYDVLYDAIHDVDFLNPLSGKKVMIVVKTP